ncbi:MAG: hypothetical protein PHS38_10510 [Bacteroidales bacterium]|nr:hypothetical protein [Bacteroidales bacterium]
MRPNKPGQITKFHTPLPDEDPDQLYVVIEIKEDVERPSAYIRALNTELSFPPINKVLLDDLEVVEVPTADLVGHIVTINKSDNSQVVGKVVKVIEQKITLDLEKEANGVATNVWLIIQDENGKEHTGNLFVK